MTCYLSVPWAGCLSPWGCLPWHIAMGLERQGEKAQKPKRSKNGHCKRRATSMQSMCTLFRGGFQLHQPGAARAGVRGELSPTAAPTGASAPLQDLVMRQQHHLWHLHPTWITWQSQAPWYRTGGRVHLSKKHIRSETSARWDAKQHRPNLQTASAEHVTLSCTN